MHHKRSPGDEIHAQQQREAPARHNQRKPEQQQRPAQPKINKFFEKSPTLKKKKKKRSKSNIWMLLTADTVETPRYNIKYVLKMHYQNANNPS